ncbi:IS21 family transposase [Marinobacter sp. X15-166B]|uniref:IS21 family transposase n=1 Tax=Marinobacter sp. X15-166B TaxID=1897620 RepID=UPI00085CDA30|nr:IS21 family transposase [Marinobacter sp. X15-166B]OEY65007.1 integrase [Marinobacter sp. X15-166B]
MQSREDFHMIKQLRKQGAHIVDIAHRIGCSERTVRRYLALPAPPTGKPKTRRPSKLDPFKPYIDEQLADEVWNAEVIFQKLRERGYTGSSTLVRGYIQPKRPLRASKRTVRYETLPGKQLQHDWGETRAEMGGRLRTVNFAVNILGYSRHFHIWAGPRQDAEHTYESLVQAFRYFGGVPASVLVDNQKAAVVRHDRDGKIIFNAGFLELANHYGFTARACRPQRPRTKGKTERMVSYVKHHFFQRYRSFDSYAHLNQLLEHWLDTGAKQRMLRRFRQTPAERFQEELPHLLPRPADDFDTRYYDIRHVGWDAYIDVYGNRYSVPAECCGQRVNIRISLDGELTVYDLRGQEVARHRMTDRKHGWQTVAEHHEPLWQEVMPVQHRSLAVYEEVLQ